MSRPFEISETARARRQERLGQAAERWLDQVLAAADQRRAERWRPDFGSLEAYLESLVGRRRRLAELLRLPASVGPPSVRREPVARHGDAVVEQLWWEPLPGLSLDALYVRPDTQRRPAVILAHQLSGTPEELLGFGQSGPASEMADGLLAAGMALVVPRLVQGWEQRLRLARKARLVGLEWIGLEAYGLIRLIDGLETLPSVDAEAVGIYGFSRGGQAALLLAALDERIAATAVASWFTDRTRRLIDRHDGRQLSYLDSPEEEQFIPDWVTEFSDVGLAWLVAPGPLLVTSGLDDPVLAYEVVETAFEAAREPYRRLGCEHFCHLALFGGGHEPLPEQTVAFFTTWLRPFAAEVPLGRAPLPRSTARPRLSRAAQARRRRARRRP